MTEETETPAPPKTLSVFTCINRRHPTRSCYLLVENTPETRQAHRQWHVDQETDREALRGAIKSRDETIAKLREEINGYRRDVAAYGQEVAGFHGEVRRVETPTIPPQLEIDRAGYTDDELDDEPDEPTPITADPELQPDPAALAEADEQGRPTTVRPVDGPETDDEDEDADYVSSHAYPTGERRF